MDVSRIDKVDPGVERASQQGIGPGLIYPVDGSKAAPDATRRHGTKADLGNFQAGIA